MTSRTTAREEYEKEKCNDIENWQFPDFEQGRSYLRDFADAALAEADDQRMQLKADLADAVRLLEQAETVLRKMWLKECGWNTEDGSVEITFERWLSKKEADL